jgi:chemotaxis protein CheY-P-specific phosphatase CheC
VRESDYPVVYGVEDILRSLCDSVVKVLHAATTSRLSYSGMIQRISRTCLKPDIGCFVLFDGGFSGLVVTNFSAASAMELYERYMLNMGMSKEGLASNFTANEVGDSLGELMNQVVGDFTRKVSQELQTHITQNQPKMLALTKHVALSVDTHLDQPQMRRVTFQTERGNIFYLEMAGDQTEFIKLKDFESEEINPDDLLDQIRDGMDAIASDPSGQDELLASLGM